MNKESNLNCLKNIVKTMQYCLMKTQPSITAGKNTELQKNKTAKHKIPELNAQKNLVHQN